MRPKNKNDLLAVAHDVIGCTKCDRLVEWRQQVSEKKRSSYSDQQYWGKGVPGFGDPTAEILIVGLAPGAHGANRTGRMFTGDRSGEWLYRAIYRAGLSNQLESSGLDDGLVLNNVYITSPVKCVPPNNKPTIQERDNCMPYLDRELDLLNPNVIIALGKFAFDILQRKFNISPRVKFSHGVVVEFEYQGSICSLIASYHVSQQNTFTGKLTEEMLDNIFSKAKELI